MTPPPPPPKPPNPKTLKPKTTDHHGAVVTALVETREERQWVEMIPTLIGEFEIGVVDTELVNGRRDGHSLRASVTRANDMSLPRPDVIHHRVLDVELDDRRAGDLDRCS